MAWPDVSSGIHRFGGLAWYVDEIEFGHIHGNTMVDIAFPHEVRDEIIASGRAEPHHMFPDVGITLHMNTAGDVDQAVKLLRLSYDLTREGETNS
jgi:hypothetical protein